MAHHVASLAFLFAVLITGFGAGVEGSTFTHEFDADGIVSFLHGLPHFDLTLHKADNRFDPKSWSYDQTMIWFVVPGAVVVALTLLLAILLAVRKCVRSCCASRREHEDSDDFDSFPTPEYRGGPVRRHRRTPTWVRCVHALTFLLMLAAIGVVVVTWLASYDFFTYVDESFEPVDDTNKYVESAFDNVETLLNMSRAGLHGVGQLNETFTAIRNDVLTLSVSADQLAGSLNQLPNLPSFRSALESWAQRQVLDLPAALPPIYSDLAAMNASLTSLPDTTSVAAALVNINASVALGQFVDISQFSLLVSLTSTINQLHAPLLNTTEALYGDLKTVEEQMRQSLLPTETSLVQAVMAGGANPPYPDDVTSLAQQIQQAYISKGDAINALPSVQQLVQKLIQYNTTASLPAAVNRDTLLMKASYELHLPISFEMGTIVQFLAMLDSFDPSAAAGFLRSDVAPALARVLDYLVVPPGYQEVYENWARQTNDLSGQMDSYHTIQNEINDYLPTIESVVDKVELGRFIYFNVTCAWMLLACLLSLLAICKPRLQTWLMVMLYVALFFAGLEMVVYLPPSVFTSDLCAAPDNFTMSLVPSDNADLAEYVTYYVYCTNQSAAANPLLPYTHEPCVNNLTEQLNYSRHEIGHLEQLSNCSTLHPLYQQMKVNVCQHLTPAAFLVFAGRGVLVVVMLVVFLLSLCTLGHQKRLPNDDATFPMTRTTRRPVFLTDSDRSASRPLLRAMTEDYLALPSEDRQLRRSRDMIEAAPSAPPVSELKMSVNY
ncbi:uncharacterized protein ACA1_068620 [Acanthamoeba castellanii str. Neff]|uniref:Uncharacterized protein n=1 Tax=Acanthamoeba castellanii (strain ATCC 30010 / Neff) TaxID=1257118 RepID=L8HET2_ACACF|nr:uncharacterized protein ACA1_068620 [Acanthamoeba castellanii str. Neff]ELR23278.1 hypothetical protein ACA1_068620 [Acanthamoeba castellanii str. Neff]